MRFLVGFSWLCVGGAKENGAPPGRRPRERVALRASLLGFPEILLHKRADARSAAGAK